MGTRCVIEFHEGEHHAPGSGYFIYQHWDGYPSGVLESLQAAIDSGHGWTLPRFEPDEFAMAYVATNKGTGGGNR